MDKKSSNSMITALLSLCAKLQVELGSIQSISGLSKFYDSLTSSC